jgi:2-oxoisovalerate dehydrogenase E1 component
MDFMGRAFDELLNQLAKWRSLSGGEFKLPVVVRTAIGKNYGAQHSQDFSAMLCHVPGLKVVYPATPYDAKGLMATALTQNDPIVFIESQKLYNQTATIPVPEKDYFIPLGKANLVQDGEDVTILSVGATLPRVLSAAAMLKKEGISAQIIDARSLVPFDYDTLLAAVRKTGRILLVSDECERGAYVKEIAATVTQRAFAYLKAPPAFACSENTLIPLAAESNAFYPSAEDIVKITRNLVKGME